jgi:hypothetical protein
MIVENETWQVKRDENGDSLLIIPASIQMNSQLMM